MNPVKNLLDNLIFEANDALVSYDELIRTHCKIMIMNPVKIFWIIYSLKQLVLS